MFKVSSIEVSGFWQKYKVASNFDDNVNIVIGKNGTGKTTFMNILHAVLSVDATGLFENDFSTATLQLSDGRKKRKISIEKIDSKDVPYIIAIYKISTRKYAIPIYSSDESRVLPTSIRRIAAEETNKLKQELSQLVALASLSVYRITADIDPEVRDRASKRTVSPVDLRLGNLMQKLTSYQLELSTEARSISAQLQRDVLVSLLYQKGSSDEPRFSLNFDESLERRNLTAAYKQLGVSGSDVSVRIREHTAAIGEATRNLQEMMRSSDSDSVGSHYDFSPLEAYQRTARVIALSLESAGKIDAVYKQIKDFLDILHSFIQDKKFEFQAGSLRLVDNAEIGIERLSSGEKQLLILFIEALLQRQKSYIFLADEPELSLHIAWQRNIISAIRRINPNAQIIVATHSPEVASKFPEKIIDMEDIRHV